jgi:PAS domain S-box-containing protein
MQFVKDLGRMVSSIVSAAASTEETKKRQRQLEHELAFSDTKLRHLIEHASVGMAHLSLDGYIIWANDYYYSLSGMSAAEQSGQWRFFDVYLDDDLPKARETWANLLGHGDRVSVELRLKRLYTSPSGEAEPAQLQVLAFPYREHGDVKSVMASTTDISRLKWAQTFQARRAAEAREAKRQQEAFIDVVSHEMRNPLGAIVHCADAITSALDEIRAQDVPTPEACLEVLSENHASAQIIMQCANHQKRKRTIPSFKALANRILF